MSFHKWMLRYMYIPLGGRRYNFLNVWVIFTFVGIWHDVAWRWIVWSLVNCFFLLIETAATTFFNGPKMERLNTSYIYYHWTSIWAPANGILICFAQLTLETAVRSHELVPTYAIAIAYSHCSISRRAIAVGWHDHRRLRRTVLVLVQCVLAAARWLGDAVDHVRLLVPALAAAPEHSSRREGPAQCLVPMVLSRLVEVTIDTYIQTYKQTCYMLRCVSIRFVSVARSARRRYRELLDCRSLLLVAWLSRAFVVLIVIAARPPSTAT